MITIRSLNAWDRTSDFYPSVSRYATLLPRTCRGVVSAIECYFTRTDLAQSAQVAETWNCCWHKDLHGLKGYNLIK